MAERYRTQTRKGESIVWLARPNAIGKTPAIPGGWTCKAGVYSSAGEPLIEPWTVSDRHTHDGLEWFLVVVTPQQSHDNLEPGRAELAIEIRNDAATPAYAQETLVALSIAREHIAQP